MRELMFDPWDTMTIALSLKVNDGLVLAADSASTFSAKAGGGVVNVYNNANKIFNLQKGLPLGAITWGAGSIGDASISTLAKDLRRRFSGDGPPSGSWMLGPDTGTVKHVAEKLKEFIFDELYQEAFKDWKEKPFLGFIVAGYSPGELMAEEYSIAITNGECNGPTELQPKSSTGMSWHGTPEAITRLISGYGTELPNVLEKDLNVPKDQIEPAMRVVRQRLAAHLIHPAMPFQDAIDLAEFLVDMTIRFYRFRPGAPVVGGPIEIAAISKHEGFKWIRRKYYYTKELNPEAC